MKKKMQGKFVTSQCLMEGLNTRNDNTHLFVHYNILLAYLSITTLYFYFYFSY